MVKLLIDFVKMEIYVLYSVKTTDVPCELTKQKGRHKDALDAILFY